jgi:hypothetical protein
MALTAEVLFINPAYAKRLTSLNGSVQDDMIVAATIIAQDKYMQTYLGTTLFAKLKSDISGSSVTGIYATVLDDYVRKATVWWMMVELLPSLYVRVDNGGLAIRGSEDTTAITTADLSREVERARKNAQHYTQRLVDYLTDNATDIDEYPGNSWPDMYPQKAVYFENGLSISGERPMTMQQILDRDILTNIK